jgi:hypothetical protein
LGQMKPISVILYGLRICAFLPRESRAVLTRSCQIQWQERLLIGTHRTLSRAKKTRAALRRPTIAYLFFNP